MTEALLLGNVALRAGKKIEWNEEVEGYERTEQINSSELNIGKGGKLGADSRLRCHAPVRVLASNLVGTDSTPSLTFSAWRKKIRDAVERVRSWVPR